ncbi:hypothetical protein BLA27_24755 [Brucella cytisi]|uniref:Uncharacterized protein n=1 Tax=Brucella cytisi TaxID=407152 RepID=A0A1J6HEM7_9HYPH|nr:hypothetical protein BLA27_24755 [Brucella cytisi]
MVISDSDASDALTLTINRAYGISITLIVIADELHVFRDRREHIPVAICGKSEGRRIGMRFLTSPIH